METALCLPEKPEFCLIETMRAEQGKGILRRALHFRRFLGSARALGFSEESAQLGFKDADRLAAECEGPCRMRLTLDKTGSAKVEVSLFKPLSKDVIWKIGFATERLDQNNPFRRLKTSERGIYDRAAKEKSFNLNELIFINKNGYIADGIITNLFVEIDGVLLTSPISDGALPGVLRASLIEKGRVIISRIKPAQIHNAERLYVGNSLRGLIQAELDQPSYRSIH